MIWLWIAAALISAAAGALIVQRAAAGARRAPPNRELAVYRRQMAEIDELADRGLLAEAERRSIRAETGRRLLAAAERAQAPLRSSKPGLILAAAAIVPIAALAAYLAVGAPDFADQPFASRLADWRRADPETLSPPQMAAILRAISAERPTDPEPLAHLAVAELASSAPIEAEQAAMRAIALAPGRADLWEMLGQIRVAEAGGDVSGDAAAAFRRELALDAKAVTARYYLARARIAGGDVAGGLADWRGLDAELVSGDPRKRELDADVLEVSATGRLAPVAGPPQADQSVGQAQIQGMVDGLAARLAAHPDDPDGWVRLVRAFTVLGETSRRDAALAEARRRYASRADILSQLDQATHAAT